MTTVINIKIDKALKQKAQKLAADLGFSLGTVINAQLRQFLREEKLEVSTVPKMSRATEQLLGSIEKDIKKGRNLSKPIHSSTGIDEYFDSL